MGPILSHQTHQAIQAQFENVGLNDGVFREIKEHEVMTNVTVSEDLV